MPSRDLTFSPTPPPQPQHHVSQGTLLHIPAVDRPSFLLLIHSDCTMLPQRRLDHSQIQRQSSSPGDYSNPLFHSHPPSHVRLAVVSLAQYYAHGLHRLVVVSPRHSCKVASKCCRLSAQITSPTILPFHQRMFQRLQRSSHALKVPP